MKHGFLRRVTALLLCGMLVLPLASCERETETRLPESASVTESGETALPDSQTEAGTETPSGRAPYDYEYDGSPIGTGVGVFPGRVTWAYRPGTFRWEDSGYWWMGHNFDADAVKTMLSDAICQLAGKDNVNDALDALIRNQNLRRTGKDTGYQAGEKIFIKTNMNVTKNGAATNNNATGYFPSPVTMKALLELLVSFGVAPGDITIGDPSRTFPSYVTMMCTSGELKGVNILSYNENQAKGAQADTSKPVTWSHDLTSDGWQEYNGECAVFPTYWPEKVTEASYLINLFNLRGHSLAGFTAAAKNHFGTIMPGRTEKDGSVSFPQEFRINPPTWSGVHHYVSALDGFSLEPKELWDLPKRDMGTYTVLVDLMSNADCGGKTFLYLCDALAATLHQEQRLTTEEKFISAPFGNGTNGSGSWTNSFLASQDPVAIDSVCLDFLLAEQRAANAVGDRKWNDYLQENGTAENYLIEAALADNPPSGTVYCDGYGNPVPSLGAHEHWNNDKDRQYSRNLGKDEGIELVKITY